MNEFSILVPLLKRELYESPEHCSGEPPVYSLVSWAHDQLFVVSAKIGVLLTWNASCLEL